MCVTLYWEEIEKIGRLRARTAVLEFTHRCGLELQKHSDKPDLLPGLCSLGVIHGEFMRGFRKGKRRRHGVVDVDVAACPDAVWLPTERSHG